MQIHELNTFTGEPKETDFLALDTGFDTAKISATKLLETKVNQPKDENNQIYNGDPGQLLRSKGDGSTEWSDVGNPTDEQTAQAVSDWLDAHPEATTTVADGSLTEAKFSNALKLKAIKDYVTPEMFGAVGDGLTDDTVAVKNALQSGKNVLLQQSYLITDLIEINNGLYCLGTNATLICSGTAGIKVNNAQGVYFEGIAFVGQSSSNRALYFYYCSDVSVIDCEFDSMYYAILSEVCNYLTIDKCNVHDSLFMSINVLGTCHDVAITRTISKDNNSQGIGISGGICTNCLISGCIIDGNGDSDRGGVFGQGINTHGIINGRIIGNIISNSVTSGIDLSGSNDEDVTIPRSKNIIIADNVFSNNSTGITLFSTQNVVIEANKIDSAHVGISIGTSVSGNFGTQNISIIGNHFGNNPDSTGMYEGVITFKTIRAQTREIHIDNNVFEKLSGGVNRPYISSVYVDISDPDIAALVSGWSLKNNVMPNVDLSNFHKVYAGTTANPFSEIDEYIFTLIGSSFTDIPIGLPERMRAMITKVQMLSNPSEGVKTVTFSVYEGSNERFSYTSKSVSDRNKTFLPTSAPLGAVNNKFSMSASGDLVVKIYYSDLC